MCGVAGFMDFSRSRTSDALQGTATRMADALQHRGPNDWGVWVDAPAGLALGFRRLSIIDLSPEGHQPMLSASGRYVVAFNGEVYNYRALRQELESNSLNGNLRFRGQSDTEVLLAAIERWGCEEALQRVVGMFALALWDREEQVLRLVRDRLGEKPLYYGRMGGSLLFGSELKALRVHPDFNGEINRDAIFPYLRHGYIPAPLSIYQGIYKLLPGSMLTIPRSSGGDLPAPVLYWSAKEVAEKGTRKLFTGSETEAIEHLDGLLRDTIRHQMVADVPLGAFLSGGIDSSTVVSLMQAQSSRPVKTFTIGFNEEGYNEAVYAKAVARYLGTEHTELYVTPKAAMGVIPKLPSVYDEPFAEDSQIPTYLVSQLASRYVTVSLTGDGSDEIFAGYAWYLQPERIWSKIGWMPPALKRMTAGALHKILAEKWDQAFGMLRPLIPSPLQRYATGDKMHKLADLITRAKNPESTYQCLVSKWNGDSPVLCAQEPRTLLTDPGQWPDLAKFSQLIMFLDMMSYLPDNHLTKVDRASMSVSLEARAPFLDHRVVEFAWQVPMALKVRHGIGKYLLRQVLYKYIPRKLIERRKMGFPVPIGAWLRGPLRDWAEALLAEDRLRREGFFDPGPIRRKWEEHLAGHHNWQDHIWHVIMFQAWLENQ